MLGGLWARAAVSLRCVCRGRWQPLASPALIPWTDRQDSKEILLFFNWTNCKAMTDQQLREMAGHSKWANIRHIKATKDAAKQRVTERISRMVKVAVKEGGSADPKLNSKLAKVVEFARSNSVPMSSITSMLQSAQKAQDNLKSYMMEYRVPGGVFLLVEVTTDNLTKSKNSISSIIKKFNVQEVRGSALSMFEEKGVITSGKIKSLEAALDDAIEVGAEDVQEEEDSLMFTCSPDDLMAVKQGLENYNYEINYASVDFLTKVPGSVTENEEQQLGLLIQKLENLDDVMRIHVNL